MPATRAIAILVAAIAASLALSLQISTASDEPAPTPVGSADWVDRPTSVGDMNADASAAVTATVTSIEDGPPLVSEPANGDELASIPTQRIHFHVDQLLDGQAPADFRLFKTGGEGVYLQNDPEYTEGESYVLFIEPRADDPGVYLPVAPDGRYHLDARGEADPVIQSAVSDDLEGLTPAEIDAEISR